MAERGERAAALRAIAHDVTDDRVVARLTCRSVSTGRDGAAVALLTTELA
jgi:hypothetical protein